ncbi:hypothetical protein CW703_00090 [Candidatus Bathyarchaeota archaeon]|nr:MAG: hypothetical protein CW703_00090 [Candidatus Bathyarchaeota archaeon]
MRIKRRKLQINITLDKDLVEAIDEGCLEFWFGLWKFWSYFNINKQVKPKIYWKRLYSRRNPVLLSLFRQFLFWTLPLD